MLAPRICGLPGPRTERSPAARVFLAIASVVLASLCAACAQATAAGSFHPTEVHSPCTILYAGFVGALETSNHKGSGVVQIRDLLAGSGYPDVCAASFIPVSWAAGRDWILTHFPAHAGPLSPLESAGAPRVILVGHSTGGWAMLRVARALREKNIPVELTVQIDSVGITDLTVPKNVKYGAIFHAWDVLMFMTTKSVKLEDPSYTTLVANILVKGASHLSITRDPRIRELVLDSIARLRAELAARLPVRQTTAGLGAP